MGRTRPPPATLWPVKHSLVTRGRATAVAIVLAAGTAGCSVNSPFQTAETQSIADGVTVEGVEGGDVDNLALVSGEEGGTATVTGAVENTGSQEITFTITAGQSKASTKVPPHEVVSLSEDKKLTLEDIKETPGDMTSVEVSLGGDTVPLDVPIVLPTGYYEDYAPDGWTPSPSEKSGEKSSESEGH